MPLTDPSQSYTLTLFVAGSSALSARAIDNIRRICVNHLDGRCELDVVDIANDPEAAETNGIVAIPTLIKGSPLPQVRLIGDMSDTDGVLARLNIVPLEAPYSG